jgi:hypothetical protein
MKFTGNQVSFSGEQRDVLDLPNPYTITDDVIGLFRGAQVQYRGFAEQARSPINATRAAARSELGPAMIRMDLLGEMAVYHLNLPVESIRYRVE